MAGFHVLEAWSWWGQQNDISGRSFTSRQSLYLSTLLLENIAWVSNKPPPFLAGGGTSSPNTLSHTGIHILLFDSGQNGTKPGPAVEATFPRALVRFASVSLSLKFSRLCQDPVSPSLRLPLAAGTDLTPFFFSQLCSPPALLT